MRTVECYHFLRLPGQIRIKSHFPLKVLITVRSFRKVEALDWMSLTTEKRVIIGKKFAI